MTILRSTGPVISTRRSSKSAGRGATVQSPLRISAVCGRKSGRSPASRRACRARARRQQFAALRAEAAFQIHHELQGFRRQNFIGIVGWRCR